MFQSNLIFAQDFKVVGYLPTYRFNAADNIEFDKLTHLNIAFAEPNGQGNLTTGGTDITPIVQQAHAAGTEVFIALAGASSPLSVWENWITSTNRSNFISGIVQYVNTHNLDGVDVDLEWGTVNDDYSGFVIELKDSLSLHGLGLTAALPGLHRYPEITAEALGVFDWINLMVYDFTGPWAPNNPGPHSSYDFAENSIAYWEGEGLEKERMTLGVPFYGYDFTDSNNVTAVTFAQMVSMDTNYANIDQVGQIYYNGIPTIIQKTQLSLNENLKGIMMWELGQDDFGEFSLLNVIHETIAEFGTTSHIDLEQIPSVSPPFPNPFSDIVNIKFNSLEDIELSVYSNLSKQILATNYFHQNSISIDLSSYPKGVYFIKIKAKTFIQNFKVLKF